MTRYTWAVRGQLLGNGTLDALNVKEEQVDIFKGAQIEENFLCHINPKGQGTQIHNRNGVYCYPMRCCSRELTS